MDKRLTAIVGARITEFRRKMAEVNKISKKSASSITKKIGANTREFTRKILKVNKDIDKVKGRSPILVKIEARTQEFTSRLSRVARTIRAFGTVGQNVIQGSLISVFSAGIPIVASLATAVASLGPVLGVAAGGALGLASGMAAAGAGAIGFGTVAVPALSKVFKAESNIKKAQDAVNNATTNKQREKALDKLNQQWASLSKSQANAVSNLESFKTFWSNMTKQFQDPVFSIFAGGLQAATTILQQSQPIFVGSVKAVNNLINSLNTSLGTPDIEAFFQWAGRSAGPALESFGKTAGNVLRGIMNLFVAFDPLAKNMEQGLQNLTKRFADWTSGLTQSTKFESFIEYVQTNGPKLLSIIGNISDGLIGMFVGFAPSASDMLTGLDNLTAKFKTWGQTLSQNKAFQNFIDYVKTNGPQVITLIGNLVNNIADLVKGMAPLGASVLKTLNRFLKWTDSMMDAHPAIAKVLGVVISLGGALQVMIPTIIAWRTAFAGSIGGIKNLKKGISDLIIYVGVLSSEMKDKAVKTVASWVSMAVGATSNAIKVASAWALSAGQAMVTAVASMVTSSAKFVARWVLMGTQSLIQAAKVATAWLIAMGPIAIVTAAVIAVVALIILNWNKIKTWTVKIFTAVWSFVKKNWQTILAVITGPVGAIVIFIVKHWSQIKSTTTQVFNAIWSFLKSIWNKTAGWIASKAEEIWSSIKNAWNKAENFLKDINLLTVGKHIITGLINGIKNEAKKLWGTVKNIAGSIHDGFMHFMHMGSPSRLMRDTIGKWIVQGIGIGMIKNVKSVISAAKQVAIAATPNVTSSLLPQTADINGGVPKLKSASRFSGKTNTPKHETSGKSSSGPIINMAGVFEGAHISIRDDRDIEDLTIEVAKKLSNMLKINTRH